MHRCRIWVQWQLQVGELNLVKPMSSSKINVPNMKTFPVYEEFETSPEYIFIVGQAVLSANPSETSDFVLMVAVNMNVGFCRSGDDHWTKIEIEGSFKNIGLYKHKLYVLSEDAKIWTWDPNFSIAKMLLTARTGVVTWSWHTWWNQARVSCCLLCGPVIIVVSPRIFSVIFGVFQIDTVNGKYTQVETLDQDAIFIGQNCGVVNAVDYPGVVKANSIYFTDDNWEQCPAVDDDQTWMPLPGFEMGICHFSFVCPPFIALALEIVNFYWPKLWFSFSADDFPDTAALDPNFVFKCDVWD